MKRISFICVSVESFVSLESKPVFRHVPAPIENTNLGKKMNVFVRLEIDKFTDIKHYITAACNISLILALKVQVT